MPSHSVGPSTTSSATASSPVGSIFGPGVWSDHARAYVAVEDDGRGVSADEVQLLSKPFFRGAQAREEQVRGSGLGLAIVQRVVSKHRRSLSIEPRTDGGSRFTIILPVRKR